MCSKNDSDEITCMVRDASVQLDENTKCRICHEEIASIVLRLKDPYCNNCFVPYVHHKFRSSLGKSKLMKPSDKVLVAFSGSESGLALLHLLWTGKNKNDAKKLLYDIKICYIEDGSLFKRSYPDRLQTVNKYKDLSESYNFNFYWSTAGLGLTDSSTLLNENLSLPEKVDCTLQKTLNAIKSLTAKEDFLKKLKTNQLVNIARELGCNKIFTAEGQTSLAVKLLSSIAQGCEQLSYEVGFEDTRYDGLKILRPMREIDDLEITLYNRIHNLENSRSPAKIDNTSIQKLTHKFISGLQEEFPSTVSTVFRTGEKLSGISIESSESENICLFCNIVYKNCREKEYLAVNATAFSRLVSRPKTIQPETSDGCSGDCSCAKVQFREEDLKNCFCYNCLLIIREMESLDNLPLNMLTEVKKRCNLLALKEQISDFLL